MKITPVSHVPMHTIDANGAPQTTNVERAKLIMQTKQVPLEVPGELPIPSNIEETKTPEASAPLSPQLALLAKQRRALQVKERELADREKALLEKNTGNSSIDVARLKAEPLRVLLENGVTYDDLIKAVSAGQQEIKPDLNALKDEIFKGLDQRFTDKEAQAEKQVLAEMQREATRLIADDTYEMVRETQSIPQVMQLIERTYRESGEVLDVTEALRLVEEELFKDAQRIVKLKKMQSQIPQQTLQPQLRPTYGSRTLTNRDTATPPLSAKARAMAAFYGTLKK